jgi:RND family efflux transporter MFP subunit
LQAQRALLKTQQVRLAQTQVQASDDGIISARTATVGAVVSAGQELFRLIRQGRLEWRAEVPSGDLATLQPGMPVRVTPAGGQPVTGRLRIVAPTVDTATRNGLVYVDLPQPGAARAGMFARGEFGVGNTPATTLPQGAVLLRDGFSYVFQVGADNKVSQVKVTVGRRLGERIEITAGLDSAARVVASGAGFLGDGDTVRVVAAAPPGIARK